jgi:hypothetical protein
MRAHAGDPGRGPGESDDSIQPGRVVADAPPPGTVAATNPPRGVPDYRRPPMPPLTNKKARPAWQRERARIRTHRGVTVPIWVPVGNRVMFPP